jgi:predicted dehydrogenase
MQKEKYTVAVIGIGRIGMLLESDPKRLKPATHFGVWLNHPRVDLVAVCDNDPKKLEVAKSLLPAVKTYSSAEQLLREIKPDIVSIATWKDTHYEMMKLCLKFGVPAIVCEKPIAEKYEHAKEVVDEVQKTGTHLLINHRRRFDSLLYSVRADLQNGIIGEIIQVSTYYVYGLVTTGTHLIDALRFFLKDIAGEIEWVAAFPNTFSHHHPPDDPCLDGFIGFENGLKVSIQSLNIQDYDIFNFYFYGRKGLMLFKNIGRDIEIFKVEESPEHQGFTELATQPFQKMGGSPRNQFRFLADNAVDCLDGKASSLSTGEDSLKALKVLLGMQESAREGGKKIKIIW